MKNAKKKWSTRMGLMILLIGVSLLIPTILVQAEETATEDLSTVVPIIPNDSDPITVLFVSPFGDSISRTVDIGSTLQQNLLSFHTALIIGFGDGEVMVTVTGNEDDDVLFASFGTSTGTDGEGNLVVTSDLGYAERDGEYTLTFSTSSFFAAIVVTAPLYPVGNWSDPITLTLTVAME
jgi:hypothetical protein